MHVGIPRGHFLDLGEQPLPLSVHRRRAGQHQAAVVLLLGDAVRLDHADRILEAVEPRDLQENRLVARDAEPFDRGADLVLGQLAVLFGQRVDRGVDEELRDRQALRELRQREHRGVVLDDELAQHRPGLTLGPCDVEVATPHPLALLRAHVDQRRRLVVVNHHDVGLERQSLGVLTVGGDELLQHLFAETVLLALQHVVERVARRLEAFGAVDHLPARVDAELLQEWSVAVQHFGHAGAAAVGVDAQDFPRSQLLRHAPQNVDRARRRNVSVVVERDRHRCRQRSSLAWRSASSQSAINRRRTPSRLEAYGFTPATRAAKSFRPSPSSIQTAKSLRRLPLRVMLAST